MRTVAYGSSKGLYAYCRIFCGWLYRRKRTEDLKKSRTRTGYPSPRIRDKCPSLASFRRSETSLYTRSDERVCALCPHVYTLSVTSKKMKKEKEERTPRSIIRALVRQALATLSTRPSKAGLAESRHAAGRRRSAESKALGRAERDLQSPDYCGGG